MTKSILISVRPENVVNILNGNKTLELRKNVPKNFTGWVYIYCTKSKKQFRVLSSGFYEDILYKLTNGQIKFGFPYEDERKTFLNGKVVARFWFDEYDTIENEVFLLPDFENIKQLFIEKICEKSCLTIKDLVDYSNGKTLYAWHIEKLEIFDEPLMLSDFHTKESLLCVDYDDGFNYCLKSTEIKKAPQSWCYVYTNKGERK